MEQFIHNVVAALIPYRFALGGFGFACIFISLWIRERNNIKRRVP